MVEILRLALVAARDLERAEEESYGHASANVMDLVYVLETYIKVFEARTEND